MRGWRAYGRSSLPLARRLQALWCCQVVSPGLDPPRCGTGVPRRCPGSGAMCGTSSFNSRNSGSRCFSCSAPSSAASWWAGGGGVGCSPRRGRTRLRPSVRRGSSPLRIARTRWCWQICARPHRSPSGQQTPWLTRCRHRCSQPRVGTIWNPAPPSAPAAPVLPYRVPRAPPRTVSHDDVRAHPMQRRSRSPRTRLRRST